MSRGGLDPGLDPKWERRECCRTTCAAESQIVWHTSASGSSIVKKTSLYTRAVPVRKVARNPGSLANAFKGLSVGTNFCAACVIRNRERKKEDKRAATVRRGVYNTNNTTVTSSSSSFAHLVVVILDFSNDHAIFHALFVSRDLPSFPSPLASRARARFLETRSAALFAARRVKLLRLAYFRTFVPPPPLLLLMLLLFLGRWFHHLSLRSLREGESVAEGGRETLLILTIIRALFLGILRA